MLAALVLCALPTARAGATTARGHLLPSVANPTTDIAPAPDFEQLCNSASTASSTTCVTEVVAAITRARAMEHVGALHLTAAAFVKLSAAEQLFVLTDLERTARHLAPFVALTAQLDRVALGAARRDADPGFAANATLSASGPIVTWGGNWASGTHSAAAAHYLWMYEDGSGGFNLGCSTAGASECWGHRDNILGRYPSIALACAGGPSVTTMGAALTTDAQGAASFTELFVASCGPLPPSEVLTWAHAEQLLGITG